MPRLTDENNAEREQEKTNMGGEERTIIKEGQDDDKFRRKSTRENQRLAKQTTERSSKNKFQRKDKHRRKSEWSGKMGLRG